MTCGKQVKNTIEKRKGKYMKIIYITKVEAWGEEQYLFNLSDFEHIYYFSKTGDVSFIFKSKKVCGFCDQDPMDKILEFSSNDLTCLKFTVKCETAFYADIENQEVK